MYDAPIKFRLTQQFGSAKVAFSQDLAKIHKSWPIYTLVHNIYIYIYISLLLKLD